MSSIRSLPLLPFTLIATVGCGGAPIEPELVTAPAPAADSAPAPEPVPTDDGCAGAGFDPAVKALVGQWRGSGWIEHGPGTRAEFEVTEDVRCDLGGEVVVLRGEGIAADSGEIVHRALGVISRDPAGGGYQMRAYSAGRPPVDSELERTREGGLIWGMSHGPAKIRFRIELAGATWREIGEISLSGGTWRQFFAMELRRTGPAQARR
jgi:hypothetical protein